MTAAQRSDCPHCDPEHRDPASRPWNVHVGPERDADGQPVRLYVQPTNGAHVAESDAAWLWQLIRGTQSHEAAQPRLAEIRDCPAALSIPPDRCGTQIIDVETSTRHACSGSPHDGEHSCPCEYAWNCAR